MRGISCTQGTMGLVRQARQRFGRVGAVALGLSWDGWGGQTWLGPRDMQHAEEPHENAYSELGVKKRRDHGLAPAKAWCAGGILPGFWANGMVRRVGGHDRTGALRPYSAWRYPRTRHCARHERECHMQILLEGRARTGSASQRAPFGRSLLAMWQGDGLRFAAVGCATLRPLRKKSCGSEWRYAKNPLKGVHCLRMVFCGGPGMKAANCTGAPFAAGRIFPARGCECSRATEPVKARPCGVLRTP
jgi:hypothetical protein